MTTAKNEVSIGLEHGNCYIVGGMNLWWGGEFDRFFLLVYPTRMSKFSTSGKGSPPIFPSSENPARGTVEKLYFSDQTLKTYINLHNFCLIDGMATKF